MRTKERLETIVAMIEENGFVSVSDLSLACGVTEMTIRRDLEGLDSQKRIRRTYGGATSLRTSGASEHLDEAVPKPVFLNQLDALVAGSMTSKYYSLLLDRAIRLKIPVITESVALHYQQSTVAVDNYQAGLAMGRWAGQYALQHWGGRANVLDLTYHLDNTRKRSKGFSDGLLEVNPQGRILLSIDAQHETAIAHQFTLDALATYPEINIIYGVTDTMAWGALTACQELNLDPQQIMVLPFGLEGNLLRDALAEGQFCKAGLAMFPEIVAPVCIEAAIAAINQQPLPENVETPFVILTTATLTDFYVRGDQEWKIQWPMVNQRLKLPLALCPEREHAGFKLPRRIGFIVPFSDHEWYINLIQEMRVYTSGLGIHLVIVDAEANLREEWAMRQRAIARAAAACIKPGEVVIIDAGPITQILAEELQTATDITVITNSISIFDVLKSNPGITLISTGGVLRGSTQLLVGPTAKNTLRELRADKLFLTTTGITLEFGLSHTNISEVTVKQAMIRSAREVILLADHSCFEQESIIQFAPVSAVHQVISDDAMPTSTRLEFNQQGIQITLAAI